MLSNGINSRLQQLQNSPSHMASECGSLGHRRQATYTQVPTRKGRAADLINKFNKLAAPKDNVKAATIGRATVNTRRDGLHQLFSPAGTPAAAENQNDPPRDPGTLAQPLHEQHSEPPRSTGMSQDDSVLSPPRQSVFLSDSELDRALSEIREFSRNMNISLGEDDIAA
ncbi:hypothetical protein H4S02_001456 [Coemansia sp. RSA 2611]|nr:hypothetical protein H4S02_001456 [Coemansia sp. RSA 2611]